MTSLLSVRRRTEEFAAAVDGHAEAGGAWLGELTPVVAMLRAQPEATPGAAFTADLRGRLIAEAATVLCPQPTNLVLPPRARGSRERRLVAAVSAVVLLGGTAGMAAAAQNALPGEALYPVKRGIERATAGLTPDPAAKGQHLLNQANDRLDEVRGLLANAPTPDRSQVPGTLDDFTAQAQQGSALLFSSFSADRDTASIDEVRGFAAQGIVLLRQLAQSAPASAQTALVDAAVALRDIDEQATALCDSCAPGLPELELPAVFLAAAEVDRALSRAQGTGQLDNSHPVVADKGDVQRSARLANRQGSAGVPVPAPAPTSAGDATATAGTPMPSVRAPVPPLPLTQEHAPGAPAADGPTDVVEDLTDGLSGVVETLLPDLNTGKLLP